MYFPCIKILTFFFSNGCQPLLMSHYVTLGYIIKSELPPVNQILVMPMLVFVAFVEDNTIEFNTVF